VIEIERLASHYRGLSDEQLERLTLGELAQLSPEALPVLRQELDRRGQLDLGNAVAAQIEGLRPSEYEALVAWCRTSPCPICGSKGELLNACRVQTLAQGAVVVGCPKCLQRAVDAASTKNTVGCLFAPLGWAAGPRAQVKNASAHLAARGPEPTESFLAFVKDHQAPLAIAMRKDTT
jgi:hypothetical protein